MAMTCEALYETLAPTIAKMDDAALADAAREAIARKADRLIIAALVAEATCRGIELD